MVRGILQRFPAITDKGIPQHGTDDPKMDQTVLRILWAIPIFSGVPTMNGRDWGITASLDQRRPCLWSSGYPKPLQFMDHSFWKRLEKKEPHQRGEMMHSLVSCLSNPAVTFWKHFKSWKNILRKMTFWRTEFIHEHLWTASCFHTLPFKPNI